MRSRRCANSTCTSRPASPRRSTGRWRSAGSARPSSTRRWSPTRSVRSSSTARTAKRVEQHGIADGQAGGQAGVREGPRPRVSTQPRADATGAERPGRSVGDRRGLQPGPARRSACACRPVRPTPSPKRSCAVGLEARDGVYWAGRATLVRRPEDIEPFDRAFAVFFEGRSGLAPHPVEPARSTSRSPSTPTRTPTTTTTTREPGERRRDDRAALLRRRGPAAQGLRRLHRRRTAPGADTDVRPPSRRFAARLAAAAADAAGRHVVPTSARPCGPPCVPAANRCAATSASTVDPAASTGPRPRRQRLDGAVRHGRCCASSTPPSPADRRSRRSRSAPA